MGLGAGALVGFGDDDDIQGLAKLLVVHLHLIDISLDVAFHSCRLEILCGQCAVSKAITIRISVVSPLNHDLPLTKPKAKLATIPHISIQLNVTNVGR